MIANNFDQYENALFVYNAVHSCTDRAEEQRVGFNVAESFSEPQKTSVSCFTAFHRKQDMYSDQHFKLGNKKDISYRYK